MVDKWIELSPEDVVWDNIDVCDYEGIASRGSDLLILAAHSFS